MGNNFRNLGIGAALVGAFLGKPAVSLFGATLLAISLLGMVLSKLSTQDIEYNRRLSATTVFFGDTVEMGVEIRNNKPLWVSLRCEDEVDSSWSSLPKEKIEPHPLTGKSTFTNIAHLGGYETLVRRFTLECTKRGVYIFGPMNVFSQDPFGLYPTDSHIQKQNVLVVYPKTVEVDDSALKELYPFGQNKAPSWIHQDPTSLKMIREYQPQDPRKYIDWKGTARSGKLQTRIFDAVFGYKIILCVNLLSAKNLYHGIDGNVFESLITAAASLAVHLSNLNFPVGLCSNGLTWDAYGNSYVGQCPPKQGSTGLKNVLTCLSGTRHFAFPGLKRSCSTNWASSSGSFKVVLTASVDKEVKTLLQDKHTFGDGVLLLLENRLHNIQNVPSEILFGHNVFRATLKGGWTDADRLGIYKIS